MMKLNKLIFIDNLPSLDLHGYDREGARIMIEDFIKDNLKLGNNYIVIIHGIGTGILREETAKTLRKNKNVLEFKLWNYNKGLTVAYIDNC